MSRYYIALGSNMGDRLAYLHAAMGQDGSTGVFERGGVGGERSFAGGFFGAAAGD